MASAVETAAPTIDRWWRIAGGLSMAGYGGGSAIFGPLCSNYLIPTYGLPATFRILAGIFLVMTMFGAFLLQNPPAGYRPEGWTPASSTAKAKATPYEFS